MESSLPTLSSSLPPFPRRHHTSFPATFSRSLRHRKIAPPLLTITASCSSQVPLRSARTVSISYTELKDKNADLSSKIEEGFGANGLGLLSISDVPEYSLLRKNLLHLSTRLGNVSEDVKRELEDPDSRYSFGWSYGKEKQDGKLDKLKASFFANPIFDVPTTEASLIQQSFKALGKLILNVGLLLAHHCDRYVSRRIATDDNKDILQTLLPSRCHKGRLLYYFPTQNSSSAQDDGSISSWSGWHTDYACLTGLTCEMFTRDNVEMPCSDNAAGLYVKSRTGQVVKPEYGEDEIAYLVGETDEILSTHLLCATPHCVRAPNGVDPLNIYIVHAASLVCYLEEHIIMNTRLSTLRRDEKFNFSKLAHIHEELRYSNHPLTYGEYSERLHDEHY